MTHSHRSFIRRWQIGDQLEWNASLGGKGTPCKLTVAAGVFVACFFFCFFPRAFLVVGFDPMGGSSQFFGSKFHLDLMPTRGEVSCTLGVFCF